MFTITSIPTGIDVDVDILTSFIWRQKSVEKSTLNQFSIEILTCPLGYFSNSIQSDVVFVSYALLFHIDHYVGNYDVDISKYKFGHYFSNKKKVCKKYFPHKP